MKRYFAIFFAAVLFIGSQTVFAHQMALPEPVLNESAGETVQTPSLILLPPELNDVYSFLWNFGSSSQAPYVEYSPSLTLAAAGDTDASIPSSIRNNKYFLESVRLANLAQQAFDEGDYDASAMYSEQSVQQAHLSDDYVRLQLKIKEADDAIAAARKRLDFAASVNAASRYPVEYSQAQAAYNEARAFRAAQSWDDAIDAANRVLTVLAYVDREAPKAPVQAAPVQEGPLPLPAQYTVRPWSVSKDCLWNIAGRPWVYNDSRKWKTLYDANKNNMPQPNNPDLIHPGQVLNIPSIRGENRQGMWDSTKTYQNLP